MARSYSSMFKAFSASLHISTVVGIRELRARASEAVTQVALSSPSSAQCLRAGLLASHSYSQRPPTLSSPPYRHPRRSNSLSARIIAATEPRPTHAAVVPVQCTQSYDVRSYSVRRNSSNETTHQQCSVIEGHWGSHACVLHAVPVVVKDPAGASNWRGPARNGCSVGRR